MKITILKSFIVKLTRILTKTQKINFLIILLLTLFLSIVETVGVSVIMPFISMASNPLILDSGYYKTVYDFFGFATRTRFIIVFGFAIICFYLFRSLYNIFYSYLISRFSLGLYRNFSKKILKIILSMPYRAYLQKNSAVLQSIITGEANNVSNLILSLMQMASEMFTIVLLYAFMVFVNWQMTIVLTVILAVAVFFILKVIIKLNKSQGKKRQDASFEQGKILRQTFGNYKFIRLKGSEEKLYSNFELSTNKSIRAQVINQTLSVMPRTILESVGFSLLIAAVIFIVWRLKNPGQVIPIISMYALSLYRILPSMNRMFAYFNSITFSQQSFNTVFEYLHIDTEGEGKKNIAFKSSIKLQNVSFAYLTGKTVIDDVSFDINKGERIAFVGESGCGKSTLIDLIIGIHKPLSGKLYIDNDLITDDNIRAWRSKIGYIPQDIYLFDGTVAENIVFGSEYDEKRITASLKMANIWDMLLEKDGIHTLVGEGGIQLSGGQKQRIGIARALYDDPDVLVLDEATSALDNETEEKIMEEIYKVSAGKTLIVIAHRLSTVERCDKQVKIEHGKIVI
jgi:ATP-binding cassette subfamily B protein/ATP-binding cassette subfamily C protein